MSTNAIKSCIHLALAPAPKEVIVVQVFLGANLEDEFILNENSGEDLNKIYALYGNRSIKIFSR